VVTSHAVPEKVADLTTVVRDLERLAGELGGGSRRVPEVSAACDALTCAAVLLRTQQDDPDSKTELLYDAIALARSAVEATKFACREHLGARPPGPGENPAG
jgi:hypothetical protein